MYLNIQKNNNEITKELFSMDERYNNNDNILNKRYKMNKIKIHNNNGYQVKEKKDNKSKKRYQSFNNNKMKYDEKQHNNYYNDEIVDNNPKKIKKIKKYIPP